MISSLQVMILGMKIMSLFLTALALMNLGIQIRIYKIQMAV